MQGRPARKCMFWTALLACGHRLGHAGGLGALSGEHPFHFPLYWEQAPWLAEAAGAEGGWDWRRSDLEVELTEAWRSLHDAEGSPGVFRYQLGGTSEPLDTRKIPGVLGLVAQRALGRANKRKPPPRIQSVSSPAPRPDDGREPFNFLRAKQCELIFTFSGPGVNSSGLSERRVAHADMPFGLPDPAAPLSSVRDTLAEQAVIVNVSPIGTFHFLLATDLASLVPQVLTENSLRVAAVFATYFSDFLRLTFNSLGAGASVDHQHWQGIYLRQPLAIEAFPHEPVGHLGAVQVALVAGWPLGTWVFSAENPEELTWAAFRVVQELHALNLAHNLCLAKSGRGGGQRLFLYLAPRRIGYFPDPSLTQVAATEAFGYWIVPGDEQFAALTEEEAERFLRKQAAWGFTGQEEPRQETLDKAFEQATAKLFQKLGWDLTGAGVDLLLAEL